MIYADYNGSAPLLKPVREYLKKRIDTDLYANPNAIHSIGQKVTGGIEKCRSIVAEVIGCYPDQVIFNSGASEGISHILHSLLDQETNKKIIITSHIDHAVVPNALKYYEKEYGYILKYVSVNKEGLVDLEHLKKLLTENKDKVSLVTIMAANNETGVLQPFSEMAQICRTHQVEFFSDTTQLIGKADFHFEKSGLDYAVCSGHKIGALTGSGFIIVKEPTKLKPLVFGSTQEHGLRGGTQNYLGVETLAIAMKDFQENVSKLKNLESFRLKFEAKIKATFPEVVIVGEDAPRLAGTTLIGYPGIHSQAVQIELESNDIFVTTSAACTDNQPETSKVLEAMGITDEIGRSVIRISTSYGHSSDDYEKLGTSLIAAYQKLKKIKSF